MQKRYEFVRSVHVGDALVRDVQGGCPVLDESGRPTYGPRAFAAGDVVGPDELHPGTLESCLRVGHVAECGPEPGPGLVELPPGPPAEPEPPKPKKK